MNKQVNKEPKNFEGAMAELDSIIEKMEQGDLALENSLEAFKRGSKLIQYCQEQIKKVEDQIKIFEKNS